MARDDLLPRIYVGHDRDDDHVEEEAGDQRRVNRGGEVARVEAFVRFLRSLGHRLEPGHEIRHDLHDQEDRQRHAGCARAWKQRLHVGHRSAREPEDGEDDERGEQPEGHHVLKHPARLDAAVIDDRDQQRQSEPDPQPRRIDGGAGNRVELVRIQAREHAREQVPGGHRFPRADDRVGQHHRPAGGKAEERRHHLFGVRDLRAGVLNLLDQAAVGVGDGKQQQAAYQETEHAAARAAARQPVIHQDEPANADHRAEAEREVLDGAETAAQPHGSLRPPGSFDRHQYLKRSRTAGW